MGALGRKCIDQIEVGVRKGGSRPKDFPFDVVKDLIWHQFAEGLLENRT